MSRKARIWIGATALLVIAINYTMITIPLVKRSASMEKKAKAIFMSKSPDDVYFSEIFRKEKRSADQKIQVVNAVALTSTVIVISWAAFGLIFYRKR